MRELLIWKLAPKTDYIYFTPRESDKSHTRAILINLQKLTLPYYTAHTLEKFSKPSYIYRRQQRQQNTKARADSLRTRKHEVAVYIDRLRMQDSTRD